MRTLQKHLQEKESERNDAKWKLIGYLIAPFIGAWLFVWYNYVWIRWPIAYWQWVVFALALWLIPKWLRTPAMGIVSTVALIAQISDWFNLITLPLIK